MYGLETPTPHPASRVWSKEDLGGGQHSRAIVGAVISAPVGCQGGRLGFQGAWSRAARPSPGLAPATRHQLPQLDGDIAVALNRGEAANGNGQAFTEVEAAEAQAAPSPTAGWRAAGNPAAAP